MFKDYTEVAEPLKLPINGKTYTIRPVLLDDGVRLMDALNPESETIMPDEEFTRIMLGDALDEMRADFVTPAAINRASLTALADWKSSRGAAEVMWETGGDPKAIQAWGKETTNRASRRQAAQAGSTKPRVSGSSTTKPRQNSKVVPVQP